MREKSLEEIKDVEKNLLKSFDEYCKKNSIRYYLAAGTLLGAVRHKGFIPWDDDLDVMVPRPDYDRLLESFDTYNTNHNIKLMYHKKGNDYYQPFAKLVDVRTYIIEREAKGYTGAGVYIDIFPIDGFGNDKDKAKKHFIKLKKLLKRGHSYIYNKSRSVFDSPILLWLYQHMVSFEAHMCRESKYAHKMNYDKSVYVANWTGAYDVNKMMLKRDIFGEPVLVPFENGLYPAPENYDRYLTQVYNDYMKYPPEDKRQSTHSFDAYWK